MRPGRAWLFALVGFVAATIFGAAIWTAHKRSYRDLPGDTLSLGLSAPKSAGEIEQLMRSSLPDRKYVPKIDEWYKLYPITNGSNEWIFALVANAPRGFLTANVYCYEKRGPELWLLRGYVSTLDYYLPENAKPFDVEDPLKLEFENEGDRINVIYRGVVIYTTPSNVIRTKE